MQPSLNQITENRQNFNGFNRILPCFASKKQKSNCGVRDSNEWTSSSAVASIGVGNHRTSEGADSLSTDYRSVETRTQLFQGHQARHTMILTNLINKRGYYITSPFNCQEKRLNKFSRDGRPFILVDFRHPAHTA